jgi:hypothetical protein
MEGRGGGTGFRVEAGREEETRGVAGGGGGGGGGGKNDEGRHTRLYVQSCPLLMLNPPSPPLPRCPFTSLCPYTRRRVQGGVNDEEAIEVFLYTTPIEVVLNTVKRTPSISCSMRRGETCRVTGGINDEGRYRRLNLRPRPLLRDAPHSPALPLCPCTGTCELTCFSSTLKLFYVIELVVWRHRFPRAHVLGAFLLHYFTRPCFIFIPGAHAEPVRPSHWQSRPSSVSVAPFCAFIGHAEPVRRCPEGVSLAAIRRPCAALPQRNS